MKKYFTIDELRRLPLIQLRNIDIDNVEYEKLVNRVVNEKLVTLPTLTPINRMDIPDIKNKEEEDAWQKVVNLREAQIRPQVPVEVNEEVVLTNNTIAEASKLPQDESKPEIVPEIPVVIEKFKPPFCDTCDSKARFHKVGCPKRIK